MTPITEALAEPAWQPSVDPDLIEARCGDISVPLCPACSVPIDELVQFPGCGAPVAFKRSNRLAGYVGPDTEPARYDDQGSWQPDDDSNAMRGLVTGACIASCIWIVLGAIAWGVFHA